MLPQRAGEQCAISLHKALEYIALALAYYHEEYGTRFQKRGDAIGASECSRRNFQLRCRFRRNQHVTEIKLERNTRLMKCHVAVHAKAKYCKIGRCKLARRMHGMLRQFFNKELREAPLGISFHYLVHLVQREFLQNIGRRCAPLCIQGTQCLSRRYIDSPRVILLDLIGEPTTRVRHPMCFSYNQRVTSLGRRARSGIYIIDIANDGAQTTAFSFKYFFCSLTIDRCVMHHYRFLYIHIGSLQKRLRLVFIKSTQQLDQGPRSTDQFRILHYHIHYQATVYFIEQDSKRRRDCVERNFLRGSRLETRRPAYHLGTGVKMNYHIGHRTALLIFRYRIARDEHRRRAGCARIRESGKRKGCCAGSGNSTYHIFFGNTDNTHLIATIFLIIFRPFNGVDQCALPTGNHREYLILRESEGWKTLRRIKHSQTPRCAGTDVDQPAAA